MKRSDKIQECDVSIRLKQFCKSMEIDTIGNLLDKPKEDLIKYKGFGRRTMKEVEEISKTVDD